MQDTNFKLETRELTEKHYAVQWRYHGNWVTYSRKDTKEDALHQLDKAKHDTKVEWRLVEITKITRRIDDGDM